MAQVGFFLKYGECLYFFLLLQDENIFLKMEFKILLTILL